jgi:hypothetical protein
LGCESKVSCLWFEPYEGMTAIGTSFESFLAAPTATDPDNTYLATITPWQFVPLRPANGRGDGS